MDKTLKVQSEREYNVLDVTKETTALGQEEGQADYQTLLIADQVS
jgi:hypothetical protein